MIVCVAIPAIPQAWVLAQQAGNSGWQRLEQLWYWFTLVRGGPMLLGHLPDSMKSLHTQPLGEPVFPTPSQARRKLGCAPALLHDCRIPAFFPPHPSVSRWPNVTRIGDRGRDPTHFAGWPKSDRNMARPHPDTGADAGGRGPARVRSRGLRARHPAGRRPEESRDGPASRPAPHHGAASSVRLLRACPIWGFFVLASRGASILWDGRI